MIYFSDFSAAGGGGGGGVFGALAHKNANQSFGGAFQAMTLQTEDYDYGAWHDTVTNNSRFTVPSGVSLARITSQAVWSAPQSPALKHYKNGAVVTGCGSSDGEVGTSNTCMNIVSAPLSVVPTDYLETHGAYSSGSASNGDSTFTWVSVEKLDAATKYAIAYHNTTQSFTASVDTALAFNSEIADTDGFHDTVTNNSRLTVPSGVTLVRLTANASGVVGRLNLYITKGGASARGLPACSTESSGNDYLNLTSAPVVVTTSDYFQLIANATGASPTVPVSTSDNDTFFSIESVPSTIKRALVYKTGSTATVAATPIAMPFDAEVYDTDSIHDNATNNTRLTVPTGCTRAKPCFSAKFGNLAQQCDVKVTKNGSDYYGQPRQSTATSGIDYVSAMGAWVDVVPGDYFEMVALTSGANSLTTDNETWFCLECE